MSVSLNFETPGRIRFGERLMSIVCVLVILPFLLLVSMLPVVLLGLSVDMPRPMEVVLWGILAALSVRYVCKLAAARCRFKISIDAERVQIGRGWAAISFPPAEVELISVDRSQIPNLAMVNEPVSVAIQGRGTPAKVFLSAEDAKACADALFARCKNALYIDDAGVEHFPEEAALQERTLLLVENRCLGLAWRQALFVPLSLAVVVGCVWSLLHNRSALHALHFIGLGVTAAVFLTLRALQNFRKARKAREARLTLALVNSQNQSNAAR